MFKKYFDGEYQEYVQDCKLMNIKPISYNRWSINDDYEELDIRDIIRTLKYKYRGLRAGICHKYYIPEVLLFPIVNLKLLLWQLKIIKGCIWRPFILRKFVNDVRKGKISNKIGRIEGSIFYEGD